MNRRTPASLAALAIVTALCCAGAMTRSLYAFTSVKTETVAVGAFVGGVAPAPPPEGLLQLRHIPLAGVSTITRKAIIQGEAGETLRNFAPSYQQRFKPGGGASAAAGIRIRIQYRFVNPNTPPGSEGPADELPSVIGPDPMGFAFEIPASSFIRGVLQYKIIAERMIDTSTTPVAVAVYPATSPANPDAFHSVGIVSNASALFGPEGGRFTLRDGNPNDGETEINVPAGLVAEPTTISLDELDPADPTIPPLGGLPPAVSVYKLDTDKPFRGSIQVSFLYQDFTFLGGQGGTITGTNKPETTASIALWDGFEWRRLGGLINAAINTITTRIGTLNYMAIVPAGFTAPEDRRPMRKIITPNGDGQNDDLLFALNDGRVEIFDIGGHRVRTVYGTNPVWDGRDDNGEILESGVYIYQYEAEGKRVSGLVSIAK